MALISRPTPSRVVILAFLAASCSGCWREVSQPVLATVLSARGAEIRRAGRAEFEDLAPSSHVRHGVALKTGPTGEVAIALLPNALIQIQQAAELEIGALSLTKDGNETGESMRRRVAHATLRRGSLTVAHERLDVAAEPDFRIETPFGALTTNYDCVFVIDVDARRTRLTAVTGFLSFEPTGEKPAGVDAGSVGEWSTAGHSAFATETDARAQHDVANALETERKLKVLRSRFENVLPGTSPQK